LTRFFIFPLFVLLLVPFILKSQALENITGSENIVKSSSRAFSISWIIHPEVAGNDHIVILFRKSFDLKEVPDRFTIHISSDNSYRLYVKGKNIGKLIWNNTSSDLK
jgi:hypothetical protein